MSFHFPGPTIHPPMGIAWILVALTVLYVVAVILISGYLRDNHEVTWKSLGSPAAFGGNFGSRILLLGFIWSGRIAALGDPRLAMLAWVSRLATVAFVAIVAACYFSEYADSAWRLY
jgi:hypothetical protein